MFELVSRKMILYRPISLDSCFAFLNRLALCFKFLAENFPWSIEMETLLFGLWIVFHYSALNRHIFPQLQEAIRMKRLPILELQLVTYWLNPFLANVPISQPLKTPENLWFSGIFRVYKMGTLSRNGLNQPLFFKLLSQKMFCLLPADYVFCFRTTKKDFGAISRAFN